MIITNLLDGAFLLSILTFIMFIILQMKSNKETNLFFLVIRSLVIASLFLMIAKTNILPNIYNYSIKKEITQYDEKTYYLDLVDLINDVEDEKYSNFQLREICININNLFRGTSLNGFRDKYIFLFDVEVKPLRIKINKIGDINYLREITENYISEEKLVDLFKKFENVKNYAIYDGIKYSLRDVRIEILLKKSKEKFIESTFFSNNEKEEIINIIDDNENFGENKYFKLAEYINIISFKENEKMEDFFYENLKKGTSIKEFSRMLETIENDYGVREMNKKLQKRLLEQYKIKYRE